MCAYNLRAYLPKDVGKAPLHHGIERVERLKKRPKRCRPAALMRPICIRKRQVANEDAVDLTDAFCALRRERNNRAIVAPTRELLRQKTQSSLRPARAIGWIERVHEYYSHDSTISASSLPSGLSSLARSLGERDSQIGLNRALRGLGMARP